MCTHFVLLEFRANFFLKKEFANYQKNKYCIMYVQSKKETTLK